MKAPAQRWTRPPPDPLCENPTSADLESCFVPPRSLDSLFEAPDPTAISSAILQVQHQLPLRVASRRSRRFEEACRGVPGQCECALPDARFPLWQRCDGVSRPFSPNLQPSWPSSSASPGLGVPSL